MAVVKIGKIKGTLARSITYVTNPGKTDGYRWASTTVGDDIADAESIARGFERALDATKGGSRRRGAVLALHVIQSFDPADPVTPRLAHLIGDRFVREITGGTHDYVIATHTDRAHVHNHILICPADRITGKVMRLRKGTLVEWRKISDRLCHEHGLHTLMPEQSGRVAPSIGELHLSARGGSLKDRLRTSIDTACMNAHDFAGFRRELMALGVDATVRGGRITYTPHGQARGIRDRRLGVAYNMLAVMGKIHRRTLSEITFHDNMVTRRTDTAVTVRVPGTHGHLHLAIPCDRLVRDGRIWHAYLSDDVRQVLTDQDGGYARSTDCEGLYAWFARPALRLEDYCRQRFGGRDLTGVGGRALRQAISCDRLADSLRELKVLARAVDEGDGRLATLGRLADSVERNARHMRALIALIADSHDRGADATGLEAQLAIEERETRPPTPSPCAGSSLASRQPPNAPTAYGARRAAMAGVVSAAGAGEPADAGTQTDHDG